MRPKRKVSRPGTAESFNQAVLKTLLIYASFEEINDREQLSVKAKMANSYDLIRISVVSAQQSAQFSQ